MGQKTGFQLCRTLRMVWASMEFGKILQRISKSQLNWV